MTGGTFLDPTGARKGARALTTAADALASVWTTTQSQVSGLHGGTPWGDDEAGTEFNKNYLQGGDKAPATVALTAAQDLVRRLQQLGPDISDCVDGTVDADDVTASWFGGSGTGTSSA
jgi:hypothetical protein